MLNPFTHLLHSKMCLYISFTLQSLTTVVTVCVKGPDTVFALHFNFYIKTLAYDSSQETETDV